MPTEDDTMRIAVTFVLITWVGLVAVVGGQLVQQDEREFSCASFPADLSEASLVERYGEANVRRASIFGADDGPQAGAVVFDGSATKLELVWWDQDARTLLAWVRTREPSSPWRTSNGIAIGMDLLSIEGRNGRRFRLAGLSGPEGRGVIRSWGSGRLRNSDLEGCRVNISLQPTGDRRIDPALYRQVVQGREFSSGHPAMQAINPQVVELVVSHDPVRRQVVP